MALLVTPGHLRRRAEFYHQLASMVAAGFPLPQALAHLHQHPPSASFRQPLAGIMEELQRGATFTEALLRQAKWLSAFDIALLEAGEKSGRLDACFKLIGNYYDSRAKMMGDMIKNLTYPAFILHFFIFVMPFPALFASGNLNQYLWQTFGVLIPIYAVVVALIVACQGSRGAAWRALLESVSRFIPWLGTGRRHMALARLSAALEALISAGVSIIEGWEMSAAASGSPALHRLVTQWRPRVMSGTTPAEAVRDSKAFPDMFTSLYMTGEKTGKLDETLRRLHAFYQESGERRLHSFCAKLARLIELGIVLRVAFYILSFYLDYFRQLSDVLK